MIKRLLLLTTAILNLTVASAFLHGQNGQDPPSPIAPTSDTECRALSQSWSDRYHQVYSELQACQKRMGDYCGRVGWGSDACLRQMNHGSWTACGQFASTQFSACNDAEQQFQCSSVEWIVAVNNCTEQVRAYQSRQSAQQEARQQSTAEEQQQADRTQRNRIETQQERNQAITSAVGTVIDIFRHSDKTRTETPANNSGESEPAASENAPKASATPSAEGTSPSTSVNAGLAEALVPSLPQPWNILKTGISEKSSVMNVAFQVWDDVDLFSRTWRAFTSGKADSQISSIGEVATSAMEKGAANGVQRSVATASISLTTSFYSDAFHQLDQVFEPGHSTGYDHSSKLESIPYVLQTLRSEDSPDIVRDPIVNVDPEDDEQYSEPDAFAKFLQENK